jgi:hypothetical protein
MPAENSAPIQHPFESLMVGERKTGETDLYLLDAFGAFSASTASTRNIKPMFIKDIRINNTGPMDSNPCPTSQGKTLEPTVTPTKNKLEMNPVKDKLCPAKVIKVGKMEAIEKPAPTVAAQRTQRISGHNRTTPMLAAQPAISKANMTAGFTLAAIGMPNNRPAVRAPQKTKVK